MKPSRLKRTRQALNDLREKHAIALACLEVVMIESRSSGQLFYPGDKDRRILDAVRNIRETVQWLLGS